MIGKSLLPKSLFGRALLILLLPMLLTQLIMAYIFFDRHWQNVSRYMAHSMAGEISFLVDQLHTASAQERLAVEKSFENATSMRVAFEPLEMFKTRRSSDDFPEFREKLDEILGLPNVVRKIDGGSTIEVSVLLDTHTLTIKTTVKRLESRTTFIYILWMVGLSIVLMCIALLFLRNQVRPIRQLAEAADSFGRGVDAPNFRPHGASEVRKAAHAFIVMRERIKRQLRTRTEMLAGISHDLRTPLTRMKLQLAMLGDSEAAKELSDDVQQMEHMIQEYLDFARGEGGEVAVRMPVGELLQDVVEDYRRLNAPVTFSDSETVMVDIRAISFRRMLHNLIDNALRYGTSCNVSLVKKTNACEILIDDEGQGIPSDKHQEVFKPFSRLDPSRNSKTGGVGLGLTIARDIILAHGGSITLDASPSGGLRVIIRLPLQN
ncbi:MAG: ATP-binding protein [Rickettsiales bacterium]|nr:ATP-binding protein [Rickettsiales bacterium]